MLTENHKLLIKRAGDLQKIRDPRLKDKPLRIPLRNQRERIYARALVEMELAQFSNNSDGRKDLLVDPKALVHLS